MLIETKGLPFLLRNFPILRSIRVPIGHLVCISSLILGNENQGQDTFSVVRGHENET